MCDFGSDFTGNYYEFELPLTFTPWNVSNVDPLKIWPVENNLEIDMDELVKAKLERDDKLAARVPGVSMTSPFTIPSASGDNKITVVGTPSISDVKALMIGIRNPRKVLINPIKMMAMLSLLKSGSMNYD